MSEEVLTNGDKKLTKEFAKELVDRAITAKNESFEAKYFGSSLGTLELKDFDYLEDGAAHEISKFNGYGVRFVGLKCLSCQSAMHLRNINNIFEPHPFLEFRQIVYIPLKALAVLSVSDQLKVVVNGQELKTENIESIYKKLLRKVNKIPKDFNIVSLMEAEMKSYDQEIDEFKAEIKIVKRWKNKLRKLINS